MTVSSEPVAGRIRDVGAIIFNLVLTSFAVVIVVASFSLRPGARLVPLMIGIPTLAGMLIFLIVELRGREPETESGEVHGGLLDMRMARLSTLAEMAAREVAEDNALSDDPESVKKRRVFVLWAVAVLLLAWFFNFYVAMALGLVSIYRYAGIGWVKTLSITGILIGIVYVTFDMQLGVRF